MHRRLAAASLVALTTLAAACGTGEETPAAPKATYTDLSAKLFVPQCATSICHGVATSDSPMLLTKADGYDALVGVTVTSRDWPAKYQAFKRVDPGNPDNSAILVAISRHADLDVPGARGLLMPPSAKVPATWVAAVRQWIVDGAPNN